MVKRVHSALLKQFPYQPTVGQEELISLLSGFIVSPEENGVFIIKGYAGTGKTTIVGAIVNALPEFKVRSVLLAPTGRAAKVLSNYSGKAAFTIHKKIYRIKSAKDDFFNIALSENLHKNTIFLVDEASMISDAGNANDGGLFSGRNLLDDLFEYVFLGGNCKLILIGDTAQLPPVKLEISPALDEKYLKATFNAHIQVFEMKDVVRQSESSGVLMNATSLRNLITSKKGFSPKFDLNNFADIKHISGADLGETLENSYSKYGKDETVVICRSNKRANIYNKQIRSSILYQENELSSGDNMMVVKNNYYWLPEESKAGFIANGDTIKINRVLRIQEMYGFRFADVIASLIDYPDEPDLEVKLLLDTIDSENPALSYDENQRLFNTIMEDYIEIPNKRKRYLELKKNPFYNALQVKFAYALTCHKTQGGQWKSVFVEQGYLTNDMIDTGYLRWLYTAITRATEKLYLVNFNKEFFV
ncbi:MAG: AAA family ATPase [Bacteroidetes bacterium]|nr:AAA family ATPase [Bacteroidota bacterium]